MPESDKKYLVSLIKYVYYDVPVSAVSREQAGEKAWLLIADRTPDDTETDILEILEEN